MKINFRGLVDLHTLPSSEPLLPLYEAVVNSIQSIEDAGIKDGKIDVYIERETQITIDSQWETDIDNIIITDNGIGFTEENFDSFDTYASDLKLKKGCKGVGRIMWLKAFNSVEISSVYMHEGEKYIRKFNFDAKKEVHKETNEIVKDSSITRETVISLKNLSTKVKKITPKRLKTIARDILNHCFVYFVTQDMPRIIIRDDNDSIDVNSLFLEYERENLQIDKFKVRDLDFKIVHSRNQNFSSANHFLSFCAHSRKVTSINLTSVIRGLEGKLSDDRGDFVYSGFVVASFLDDNVNRERTGFNISEDASMLQEPSKKEIIDSVEPLISTFLKDDICKYLEDKRIFIDEYIKRKNPRYRYLMKNFPALINDIPWVTDEEKLELELFKQEQTYKLKLKLEGHELEKEAESSKDYREIIQKKTIYAEKISEVGKSNLAEYILHRKTVLEILDNNLKYMGEGDSRHFYEENIHQIIFPMRKTSDDIDYQSHNLWIIDEKLAYHYYLASDKKISSMSPIQSDSGNEPDIMIFDFPFAFTDEDRQPFRNITIIEFKRPGRKHYTVDENPIQQVIEYMDDVLAGKIKTRDGRYIEQNENIRFSCYILCDIEDKIKMYAKQRDFDTSPDGMGYYRYISAYKAIVEIISYTKLIQDSKQRNKILFDKLFNQ